MIKRPLRSTPALVALSFFGNRSLVAEDEVAKEGAQGDCDHDPSIVGHENQPALVYQHRVQSGRGEGKKGIVRLNSHQHERVKRLYGIQDCFDQAHPLVDVRLVLPCCPRQRRSLSNDVASGLRKLMQRYARVFSDASRETYARNDQVRRIPCRCTLGRGCRRRGEEDEDLSPLSL